MRLRLPLVAVAAFAISSSVFSSQSFAQDAKPEMKIQENMQFTLRNTKGEDVNFKQFLGKGPVLLNFWALWCEPCKQEMKAFKGLTEKFKEKGVQLVAINTDNVRSLAKVGAYVKTQEIQFPVLTDPDGSVARDVFSMESLPYSLILNPDGSVYRRHIGYTAGDESVTEKELVELIGKLEEKK